MAKISPKLNWCKVRLGKDLNWWVAETSDKVNWDIDGYSLLDPRQATHMLETIEGLRDYGLDESIVEKAFIPFSIGERIGKTEIKLLRSEDSVLEADEQQLFLLPDTIDDERSTYAELLDHITALQIKMLNDTFDFEKDISIEDMEEEIRENYSNDYMEGKAIHCFHEIMDILEYAPEGYSLEEDDEEDDSKQSDDENYEDIEDLPDEEDENIEEDETMHWEDEEEEGGNAYRDEDDDKKLYSSLDDDEDDSSF